MRDAEGRRIFIKGLSGFAYTHSRYKQPGSVYWMVQLVRSLHSSLIFFNYILSNFFHTFVLGLQMNSNKFVKIVKFNHKLSGH
jgi:hypothetical protein